LADTTLWFAHTGRYNWNSGDIHVHEKNDDGDLLAGNTSSMVPYRNGWLFNGLANIPRPITGLKFRAWRSGNQGASSSTRYLSLRVAATNRPYYPGQPGNFSLPWNLNSEWHLNQVGGRDSLTTFNCWHTWELIGYLNDLQSVAENHTIFVGLMEPDTTRAGISGWVWGDQPTEGALRAHLIIDHADWPPPPSSGSKLFRRAGSEIVECKAYRRAGNEIVECVAYRREGNEIVAI